MNSCGLWSDLEGCSYQLQALTSALLLLAATGASREYDCWGDPRGGWKEGATASINHWNYIRSQCLK